MRVLPRRLRTASALGLHRLRPRLLPIAHTAAAAVVAWYLALVLLPDPRPAFASIAAVIAGGATYGSRGARAPELIRGVGVGPSGARRLRPRARRRPPPKGGQGGG